MKINFFKAFALGISLCTMAAPTMVQATDTPTSDVAYVAHLHPMNSEVTGREATGKTWFTINDDTLTIHVKAQGLPPGIMHLQHIHGFKEGGAASCPTQAADTNGDGIVDLIETEPASGTTMVPFTADPASMKIVVDTYPDASADGSYHYQEEVSLKSLEAAFAKAFDGQQLDLEGRVVYIHGVLPDTELPSSVASLGTIPAQVTLPIACGEIERVAK